jgi:hypothetical protein
VAPPVKGGKGAAHDTPGQKGRECTNVHGKFVDLVLKDTGWERVEVPDGEVLETVYMVYSVEGLSPSTKNCVLQPCD